MAASVQLTPKDYIAWVQRSLNRLLDSGLATNGQDSAKYREQVRELQLGYGLSQTGEVGPLEQDAMVRANNATFEYVSWVQAALSKLGLRSSAASNGLMDSATRSALREFQLVEGLKDDGWVGPKTEKILIARCKTLPPGDDPTGPKSPTKNEEITISIDVGGYVPKLVQRGKTCWAAAFAMMYGWKWGTKSIVQAFEHSGADGWYLNQYQYGNGLSDGHMGSLAKAFGLKGEQVMLTNWVATLRDCGPLMVVQPSIPGYVHWLIVTGIKKTMVFPDRSLDRDELKYNEPGTGGADTREAKALAADAARAVHTYKYFHF